MRVIQVSFHNDPRLRDPEALLEAWPTLGAVAEAATRAGADTITFRRLTGNGAVGALFPIGAADALAAAVLRVTDESADARRAAARRHFDEHLAFDRLGRDLANAYAEVVR